MWQRPNGFCRIVERETDFSEPGMAPNGIHWADLHCLRIKLASERYGSGAIDRELILANHMHELDAGKHIAGRSE